MTSTEMPRATAKPTSCPNNNQTVAVITAIAITTGTKIPDTLSASLAIGALVAAASSTSCTIRERVVFSPTSVARQTR